MRKSPIKVKLTGERISGTEEYQYHIVQITGAITVWTKPALRVGDTISETQAEHLATAYQVTVTK